MKIFIGIDVGDSGGVAVIDDTAKVLTLLPMPNDRDLLELLRIYQRGFDGRIRAVVEKVASSPVMGVKSAFTFGGSYRAIKMALLATEIPFDEVLPKKWQRRLECLSGGEKIVTKLRAQQLFPALNGITHATADALLLAEYCRREHIGQPVATVQTDGTYRLDDLGPLK